MSFVASSDANYFPGVFPTLTVNGLREGLTHDPHLVNGVDKTQRYFGRRKCCSLQGALAPLMPIQDVDDKNLLWREPLPDRLRQKSWSHSSVSCVAARKIVRRSCLGARPRYNLVVDEDVKKPTKQTNKKEPLPNSISRESTSCSAPKSPVSCFFQTIYG